MGKKLKKGWGIAGKDWIVGQEKIGGDVREVDFAGWEFRENNCGSVDLIRFMISLDKAR